ncbi:hypothetical protein FHX15_001820 [Rhizobium sp. BK650]|nr:hypothetical protein [Rhizobium sp. BK650]
MDASLAEHKELAACSFFAVRWLRQYHDLHGEPVAGGKRDAGGETQV